MCDYKGCASGMIGLIDVIRIKDNYELHLCPHCAYIHLACKLVKLKNKKG